ncbi:triphosphoribosyl-dephospho-CoA synthase CitG [Avibacterium sp. 20-126]|uniref:triphosphoribosyl-dephospho-CoA synthase CitG n=1 Tax=Avibacterium sp. 20-126 TaxID=2911524 RepID=UPI00218BAE47|nr:triphosphoribosyl-dephospho-CoA synthase CitG [Avibacterium sp. 20-126]
MTNVFSQQGDSVSLMALLDGKEQRAKLQRELCQQYHQTLLSVTVIAPGAVKRNPLLSYVFKQALCRLNSLFKQLNVKPTKSIVCSTESGDEAFFVLPIDAKRLKQEAIILEETSPIGRLWDFDIFTPNGDLVGRNNLGYSPRDCLICGDNAKSCARSRQHSLSELQNAMFQRVAQHQLGLFTAKKVRRALWKEASLTPKPGLVDRDNNGAHQDMDLHTFIKSIKVLTSFWQRFVWLGCRTALSPPQQVLPELRKLGLEAEQAMFKATQGVNTHKGGIFAFGLTCAAIGRCWTLEQAMNSIQICTTVSDFCCGISQELNESNVLTAGIRIFQHYGIKGARGEAELGFPLVRDCSLPYLKEQLNQHIPLNQALLKTLLMLFVNNQDSNVIHRGGIEGLAWFQGRAKQTLSYVSMYPERLMSELTSFNQECIEKNISAGGCADLLALTYFFFIFFN